MNSEQVALAYAARCCLLVSGSQLKVDDGTGYQSCRDQGSQTEGQDEWPATALTRGSHLTISVPDIRGWKVQMMAYSPGS